jgi:hypothetical protein
MRESKTQEKDRPIRVLHFEDTPQSPQSISSLFNGTVHVEIILEVPRKMAREVDVILKETMIQAGKSHLSKVPVEMESLHPLIDDILIRSYLADINWNCQSRYCSYPFRKLKQQRVQTTGRFAGLPDVGEWTLPT